MNELEEQLRRALRRCEPPEGFARRVVARAVSDRERQARLRWRLPALRWATVAVLLLAVAAGFGYRARRQEQERAEAMVARRQVMIALRITGTKLRIAQERVKAMESGEETKAEKTL